MPMPVDLQNLREMTDGDKELEKQLFTEFFISSEECIAALKSNCSDGENEAWRAAAHALKGTSYNLGAAKLGDLCKKAQENHSAPSAEKQSMLSDVQLEYESVREFLKNTLA